MTLVNLLKKQGRRADSEGEMGPEKLMGRREGPGIDGSHQTRSLLRYKISAKLDYSNAALRGFGER